VNIAVRKNTIMRTLEAVYTGGALAIVAVATIYFGLLTRQLLPRLIKVPVKRRVRHSQRSVARR
jgi:hypothetical protein